LNFIVSLTVSISNFVPLDIVIQLAIG